MSYFVKRHHTIITEEEITRDEMKEFIVEAKLFESGDKYFVDAYIKCGDNRLKGMLQGVYSISITPWFANKFREFSDDQKLEFARNNMPERILAPDVFSVEDRT